MSIIPLHLLYKIVVLTWKYTFQISNAAYEIMADDIILLEIHNWKKYSILSMKSEWNVDNDITDISLLTISTLLHIAFK